MTRHGSALRPWPFACSIAGGLGVLLLAGAGCQSGGAGWPRPSAETRALRFLGREVPAWSRENGCFSCHNNGDAARALYAGGRHHRVPAPALADTTAWLSRPDRWEHNQGDPGFSDQRLADLQFAAALLAATDAGILGDAALLQGAARRIAASQDADGAWRIEPQNPVGSPATWGTAVATLMGWRILLRADAPEARDHRAKAQRWLRSATVNNTPTAAVKLLAFGGDPTAESRAITGPALEFLRAAQTADGGWGPYGDSPPEVFDTALALLALAEAGGEPGVATLRQRGRRFLLGLQQADGGWPPTTRPSGGDSYAQRISTTGWATLALLNSR